MLLSSEDIGEVSLMRELFASIRDVNCRIDELKTILRLDYCKSEESYAINRIESLRNTRLCLIQSIYDIRDKCGLSFLGDDNPSREDFFKRFMSI